MTDTPHKMAMPRLFNAPPCAPRCSTPRPAPRPARSACKTDAALPAEETLRAAALGQTTRAKRAAIVES